MLTKTDKPVLLLVEDDEDDAFFFNRKFQQSGVPLAVHRVLNGGAAIEFLRSAMADGTLPQVVFLDLKMPVLNGFDVLSWMQKQAFPVPIPVVVLSGSNEQQDKDRAQRLGAAYYQVKPVRAEDFHRLFSLLSTDEVSASASAETGAPC